MKIVTEKREGRLLKFQNGIWKLLNCILEVLNY